MQNLIKNYFTDSIQTQIVMAEALSQPIEEAANIIINALLRGNKILSCGNGVSAANVLSFTAQIIQGIDIERPSIPAITLVSDSVLLSSICQFNHKVDEVYAKQIQALSQQGDILIVLSTDGKDLSIFRAIQEAVIKDLTIIALTGYDGGDIVGLLGQNDIEIRIPSSKKRMINEMHMLVLNCLCQLIENILFIHKETN